MLNTKIVSWSLGLFTAISFVLEQETDPDR